MGVVHEAAAIGLENGDVMSREEFHRRYGQCEELHRVELIEGVVYMPSPIKVLGHAHEQTLMMEWLAAYAAAQPGVEWSPPATVLLDDENEPEPDAMLYRLTPDRFEDDYVLGAPELIVESASSSVSRDVHQKKRAYERNGVLEYIVWRTRDKAIDWFQLREGAYVRRDPGGDGIIESETFARLRLDVGALLAGDRARVLAALA
ncbi:MAG: Uma2 family endonuclease [Tepidiformaceae bacterium]